MHVVATVGHVDHGKSSLVQALTGTDPDRFAEEKRRGLTIDLGFAWTSLADLPSPPADPVLAFVDVPGHERFIATMLAGLGPAPAVMFVVAADEGWRQQSDDHLAAVDALRLQHGLVVITRSDLADPGPAMAEAQRQLRRSSLGDVSALAVSAKTGQGLPGLRLALADVMRSLPNPSVDVSVRLWVDRSFRIRGAGTVITGTLGAGTLRVGDELQVGDRVVRVRGLQSLNHPADVVAATARVAVNLRGIEVDDLGRGDALLTPGAWHTTDSVDIGYPEAVELPAELQVHLGTAAVAARVRPLGSGVARLTTAAPLPVAWGDRLVLRDPGRHRVIGGALVLDPDPPRLRRRGSGARRGAELAVQRPDTPADAVAGQVHGRGAVRRRDLRVRGFAAELTPPDALVIGDWLISAARWQQWQTGLRTLISQAAAARPLDGGTPSEVAVRALGLPDAALAARLAEDAGLILDGGRIRDPAAAAGLGPAADGLDRLVEQLQQTPFLAPEHDQLLDWGLGVRELAAAERLGRLVRLAPEIVLLPDGPALAMRELVILPQPFTASEARRQLGTTRRVIIPLLEHLDRRGWTVRDDANHRRVASSPGRDRRGT